MLDYRVFDRLPEKPDREKLKQFLEAVFVEIVKIIKERSAPKPVPGIPLIADVLGSVRGELEAIAWPKEDTDLIDVFEVRVLLHFYPPITKTGS